MHTFIIATLSADGFIAPVLPLTKGESEGVTPIKNQPSTIWSSPEDTQWFRQKTLEAGTVIMGRKTYQTIPEKFRPLSNRLNIIYTQNQKLLQTSPADFYSPASVQMRQHLDSPGVEKQSLPNPIHTNLPAKKLIDQLTDHTDSLAVSGGTQIYTMFLKAGVVDTLYLTYEPIIFGHGTRLFDKHLNTKLKLNTIHHLSEQTKVMEYKVSNY